MNKRRKYTWKSLVFVNCCYYFKQSFFIFFAMHCDVLLLGYISNIYVWSEPPECTDILRYILSCRASAIYGLPINLRYIWKRCSPLVYICKDIHHIIHMPDVEKLQISPHLSCGEIWNYSTWGEISDFSTSFMHTNLKFLHMTNFSPHI